MLLKQVEELQAAQEKVLQDEAILKEELEDKNKKILLLQDEAMVHKICITVMQEHLHGFCVCVMGFICLPKLTTAITSHYHKNTKQGRILAKGHSELHAHNFVI